MAVPLEAANMYFRDSSVDVGISAGAGWLEKLMYYEFKLIHWPGLYASYWFDSIGFPQIGSLAIVTSGYLDTVLLLIAVIFVFRSLRRRGSKRSSLPDDPTET